MGKSKKETIEVMGEHDRFLHDSQILADYLEKEEYVLDKDIIVEFIDNDRKSLIVNAFHNNSKIGFFDGGNCDPSVIHNFALKCPQCPGHRLHVVSNSFNRLVADSTLKMLFTLPDGTTSYKPVPNHKFSVGICSSNIGLFKNNKATLVQFSGELMAYGIPYDICEENIDGAKLYVLTNGRR